MAQIPGDYNKTRPDNQETQSILTAEAIKDGDLVKFTTTDGVTMAYICDADGDNWDGVALGAAAASTMLRVITRGYVPTVACTGSVVVGSLMDSNGSTGTAGTAVLVGATIVTRLKALTAISGGFCEAWIR